MEDNLKYSNNDVLKGIFGDSCKIIEEAQNRAFHAINTALTIRNWLLGERISREHLGEVGRADYGKNIMKTLATMLTKKYGKGFDQSALYQYVKFYSLFPDILDAARPKSEIVDTVRPKLENLNTSKYQLLPWTLYRELIRVENEDARKWYEKEATKEIWSYRTLHRNIASQYYFRMLQTQEKEKVAEEMHALTAPFQQDKLEFIKNPVVAEFLGYAQDTDYTESDLEQSIISHIQKFVMEMGKGFAFVARQKHIRTDMGDFYIDLVFYNYILKCFFLIDLKTTQISHQDVGQMDMYVRMYDEMKRDDSDNPTLGIVLCSETDEDIAKYSVMQESEQLFAAKYKLCLPSEDELRAEIETQKEIFYMQHPELRAQEFEE